MRETREWANRVEVKPVVSSRPRFSDSMTLVENHRIDAASLQRAGGAQASRAGPNDDDLCRHLTRSTRWLTHLFENGPYPYVRTRDAVLYVADSARYDKL